MALSDKIIKAQKELLLIFDSIPDPICIIDRTLSIKRLNMAMAEILGTDIKDVLGSPCYGRLMGKDTPCEFCYFKGESGNLHWYECKFMERKGGADNHVFELTIYPFPDTASTSAVFHFKDVSDKVKIEKHLEKLGELLNKRVGEKQSEIEKTRRKYEEIIDHVPIGISILDERMTIMAANPAFGAILGIKTSGLIGVDFSSVFGDEKEDWFHPFFGELLKSGAHSAQVTYKDKGGAERELVIIGLLIDAPKTDSHDIVVMIQDMTEARQAERALIASERMAQVLLNATTDIALLTDTDGTIIAINESAAKIMGKSRDELIGSFAFEIFSEDIIRSRKEAFQEVIRTKKPVRFEDERDGLHLDNSIYPVFNAKGKVDRVAVFAHNITQRKTLMQELISRETYAASGRMSATLVRELNKRILKVKHNLGIFGGKIGDEPQKMVLLKKIIDELEGTRNLLEQTRVFYLSKKEEQQLVNINDIISGLIPIVESRLRDNNITLKTSFSKKLPEVFAYPAMIRQALVHLINNADDAMRKGGTIRIVTQKRGNTVQIIVNDQGDGMDKKTLEKVKAPDYTGERGRVALGLFICKDIMKNSGGRLDIAAVKGEGAKVTLSFPLFSEVLEYD
ncbi:MAG: PAS domain S-box protein [Deltaproteobacteria bacterium]|nr:PAS domain S-box protein [Candidatus Zymogenaceae bacterium]